MSLIDRDFPIECRGAQIKRHLNGVPYRDVYLQLIDPERRCVMPASPRGGLYGPLKDWFEDDLDLSIAEGVEIFEAPGKGALGSIRDCVESLSQNYKAGRLPPA